MVCESERPARAFRFRPEERLHSRKEFTRIMRVGKRLTACGIRLRYAPNGLDRSRLGLTVGRRAGKAVRRNRIRRLLREGFRLSKHMIPQPLDIVVLPIPGALVTLDGVRRAFARLAYEAARSPEEPPPRKEPRGRSPEAP